jgi:hypothetical protein
MTEEEPGDTRGKQEVVRRDCGRRDEEGKGKRELVS